MPDDDPTRLPDDGPKGSLLSVGQQFGQYKVVRLLGRGGMGEVYEVAHAVLHRSYALKVIRPEVLDRPSAVERFRREAKVMNHLAHPNIVQVDDFGETDGHFWLRMELIGGLKPETGDLKEGEASSDRVGRMADSGSSLADLLTDEPLPEGQVADLLKQILAGLAYAHEQGVVHRDLKPANLLLEPNNLRPNSYTPKITDFGLVRLAGEQWLQSQVQLTVARSMTFDSTRLEGGSGSTGTSTQALLGTFEFMSPEQRKGQEATTQSDLYAIGLIAFRMLTGQDSPGMETASQIVEGLNPEWDAWLIRALKQNVVDRYKSASEMLGSMPKLSVSTGRSAELSYARVETGESKLEEREPPYVEQERLHRLIFASTCLRVFGWIHLLCFTIPVILVFVMLIDDHGVNRVSLAPLAVVSVVFLPNLIWAWAQIFRTRLSLSAMLSGFALIFVLIAALIKAQV